MVWWWDVDLEGPLHISELNSAIAFLTLKMRFALFSSEMCSGASKSTSHRQTIIWHSSMYNYSRHELINQMSCLSQLERTHDQMAQLWANELLQRTTMHLLRGLVIATIAVCFSSCSWCMVNIFNSNRMITRLPHTFTSFRKSWSKIVDNQCDHHNWDHTLYRQFQSNAIRATTRIIWALR